MRYIVFSNGEELQVDEASNHNRVIVKGFTFDEAYAFVRKYSAYDWNTFTFKRVTTRDTKEFQYSNYKLIRHGISSEDNAETYVVEFHLEEMTQEELYKEAFSILMEGES